MRTTRTVYCLVCLIPLFALMPCFAGDGVKNNICEGLVWWQGDDTTGWCRNGEKLQNASSCPEGKVSKALTATSVTRIAAAGMMDFSCGTWAAWIKKSSVSPKPNYTFFRLSGDNFQLVSQPAKQRLFFMTGGNDPVNGNDAAFGEFRWDYSASAPIPQNWEPTQWRHIAVCWDQKAGKQIWIDGKLAASGSSKFLERVIRGQYFHLGDANAPLSFDEVMLWSRRLSPEEIARLVTAPDAVAGEVAACAIPVSSHKEIPLDIPLIFPSADTPATCILEPGSSTELQATMRNPGAESWSGTVTLLWRNWRDQECSRTQHELTLKAGESVQLPAPLTTSGRNLYKLSVQLECGGQHYVRDVATIASWPIPQPDQPFGFFGHHVGSWSPACVNYAQRLGIRLVRGHNMIQSTWWTKVEPEENRFDWRTDNQMARWSKFAVLGQFFGTPEWAPASGPRKLQHPSGQYPSGSVPRKDAFLNYVRTTAQHFKGQIREWEFWNEPEVSMFWQGSPEELAELISAGAAELKKVDAQAYALGIGFTGSSWNWHKAYAAAGGLKNLDAISFHAYHSATDDPELQWRNIKAITDHFKNLSRESLGRELPLWDTESAPGDDSWFHNVPMLTEQQRDPDAPRRGAYSEVFFNTMLMQCGVKRSYSYLWNLPPRNATNYTALNALDVTGTPKLRTLARQAMDELVGRLDFKGLLSRPEGRLRAALWSCPEGTLVLFYTGQEAKLELQTVWPGNVLGGYDLLGNQLPAPSSSLILGEEPVYYQIAATPGNVQKALEVATVRILRDPKTLPALNTEGGHKVPALPPFPSAMEQGAASQMPVDISAAANMGFFDDKAGDGKGGWADEGPYNCLQPAPVGQQMYYGVRFNIIDPSKNGGKAIITLPGVTVPNLPRIPPKIALKGATAGRIWFLHASNWSGKVGRLIATYHIRYADGSTADLPVKVDDNIRDWWFGYSEQVEARPVPLAITNGEKGNDWRYLHITEWVNPQPQRPLESITLESAGAGAAVMIIAITMGK